MINWFVHNYVWVTDSAIGVDDGLNDHLISWIEWVTDGLIDWMSDGSIAWQLGCSLCVCSNRRKGSRCRGWRACSSHSCGQYTKRRWEGRGPPAHIIMVRYTLTAVTLSTTRRRPIAFGCFQEMAASHCMLHFSENFPSSKFGKVSRCFSYWQELICVCVYNSWILKSRLQNSTACVLTNLLLSFHALTVCYDCSNSGGFFPHAKQWL